MQAPAPAPGELVTVGTGLQLQPCYDGYPAWAATVTSADGTVTELKPTQALAAAQIPGGPTATPRPAPPNPKHPNWMNYTTPDGLVSNNVSDIVITPDGVVWFGTTQIALTTA